MEEKSIGRVIETDQVAEAMRVCFQLLSPGEARAPLALHSRREFHFSQTLYFSLFLGTFPNSAPQNFDFSCIEAACDLNSSSFRSSGYSVYSQSVKKIKR